jgi:hypothetical protein
MEAYIRFVADLRGRGPSTAVSSSQGSDSTALSFKVSTMTSDREVISDGQKSIFQWAEEGNLERVLAGLSSSTINQQDDMVHFLDNYPCIHCVKSLQ